MKKTFPKVEVGQRFTVAEFPHLPPVELVRKSVNTWVVAELRPDGTDRDARAHGDPSDCIRTG